MAEGLEPVADAAAHAHAFGSPAACAPAAQVDHLGNLLPGVGPDGEVHISAAGHLPAAGDEAVDRQADATRPRVVTEEHQPPDPDVREIGPRDREPADGGGGGDAGQQQAHEPAATKERVWIDLIDDRHRLRDRPVEQRLVDVVPRIGGELDRRREAVAEGWMTAFEERRERRIVERRGEPPEQFADQHDRQADGGGGREGRPHPRRWLDQPVEGERRPENCRAGQQHQRQRLDPDPAPRPGAQRSQQPAEPADAVGAGRTGRRFRGGAGRWIEDEGHADHSF